MYDYILIFIHFQGTLKLDVCLEKRVNQQNLQRRKAIRQNKIHYHRHHAFKVKHSRMSLITIIQIVKKNRMLLICICHPSEFFKGLSIFLLIFLGGWVQLLRFPFLFLGSYLPSSSQMCAMSRVTVWDLEPR